MFFATVADGGAKKETTRQLPIDEGLFTQIGQNNREAFEKLYNATQRAVYAYALSLLKNPQDALDITQETYLKIRAAAHLYKPQGKPLAWMFTITKNLCHSLMRQQGKTVTYDCLHDDLTHGYIKDPTDRLALNAVLIELDDAERQIVLLHVICGLKHREIAQDLNIPLGTVLTCYHRGLKKLKQRLTEGGGFHG